jgi:hypothetical protein
VSDIFVPRRPLNVQYVWAIAFMSLLIVATVLLINLIRPKEDNTAVITMVISSLGSTTISLLALLRTNDTHECVRKHIESEMPPQPVSPSSSGTFPPIGPVAAALLLLLPLAGCGPTPAQIYEMGTWSAAARAACKIPGACPAERSCILSIIEATRLGNVNAKTYKAAKTACQNYGAAP